VSVITKEGRVKRTDGPQARADLHCAALQCTVCQPTTYAASTPGHQRAKALTVDSCLAQLLSPSLPTVYTCMNGQRRFTVYLVPLLRHIPTSSSRPETATGTLLAVMLPVKCEKMETNQPFGHSTAGSNFQIKYPWPHDLGIPSAATSHDRSQWTVLVIVMSHDS
jgi:hypothetical protein